MELWFEDLTVGFHRKSDPLLLTKDAIKRFAAEFDPQPFHLDEHAAAQSVFGELVASGAHTFALTMRLGVDSGVFTGNAVAGLGVDDMRFLRPVRPDSLLRATFQVTALRASASRPALGIVHWKAITEDQSGSQVFSAVIKNLVKRSPKLT